MGQNLVCVGSRQVRAGVRESEWLGGAETPIGAVCVAERSESGGGPSATGILDVCGLFPRGATATSCDEVYKATPRL